MRTNNHEGKLKALLDALAMELVRQVVEANIASKLLLEDGNLAFSLVWYYFILH
jgi:hypothetical protein